MLYVASLRLFPPLPEQRRTQVTLRLCRFNCLVFTSDDLLTSLSHTGIIHPFLTIHISWKFGRECCAADVLLIASDRASLYQFH
jgi:hypothetical protein